MYNSQKYSLGNNVTDYRIIVIPKSCRQEEEAEQKESLYPEKLH